MQSKGKNLKLFVATMTLISTLFALQASFPQDVPTENSFFETKEEKELFQIEIQRFILENPAIIIEAIQLYQKNKEKEAEAEELQILNDKSAELFQDNHSFIGGNNDGKIKIVEFMDYKCGYCKKNHSIIWSIIKENSDVKYIVKEFPILGPQSTMAAQALLSVLLYDSNKTYKSFSDHLISYSGPINIKTLKAFAELSGSKIPDLETTMKSEKVNLIITKNASLAKDLRIEGTPTFIIEDQIIRGFISKNQMQELIELTRKKL